MRGVGKSVEVDNGEDIRGQGTADGYYWFCRHGEWKIPKGCVNLAVMEMK